jgi:23S rRNA (cytidine1920-2'-O)/16S rRNA (cytidine1409-2'-O)-methyltransferase
MKRERIDKLLVDRGLIESRTKAQAVIMAGSVLVDERRVEKPSESYPANANIRIKGGGPETRYVSRGGLKLEAALAQFDIHLDGFTCIDVGSSTGGFTDCLLQHDAKRVVAVDSGTNQMVWSLRTDPRVTVMEKTNARDLRLADFDYRFDIAVVDVSFISVTKLLPVILPLLTDRGRIVTLIKPQFEVGKGEVGKGGIVREPEKHDRVVAEINSFAESLGLVVRGVIESPILGAEGNKEFLALYERRG